MLNNSLNFDYEASLGEQQPPLPQTVTQVATQQTRQQQTGMSSALNKTSFDDEPENMSSVNMNMLDLNFDKVDFMRLTHDVSHVNKKLTYNLLFDRQFSTTVLNPFFLKVYL